MSSAQNTMDGSIARTKTLVETPAAMFAGDIQMPDRKRLRIANLSHDTRLRVGAVTANLQRAGMPVEPGDTVTFYPIGSIYGCSEGAQIKAQIEEK